MYLQLKVDEHGWVGNIKWTKWTIAKEICEVLKIRQRHLLPIKYTYFLAKVK